MARVTDRHYRIVTNGFTFRVQGREQRRWWFFSSWSRWSDYGPMVAPGFIVATDYPTLEAAEEGVQRLRKIDAERDAQWKVVSPLFDELTARLADRNDWKRIQRSGTNPPPRTRKPNFIPPGQGGAA